MKKVLWLFIIFLLTKTVFTQNINVYTDENVLPTDSIPLRISIGEIKEKSANISIYKISDLVGFIKEFSTDFEKWNLKDPENKLKLVREEKVAVLSNNPNWWYKEILLEPLSECGGYVAKVSYGNRHNYFYFNVSRLGWTIKKSENQLLVYTCNRLNSSPKPTQLISITKDGRVIKKNNPEGLITLTDSDYKEMNNSLMVIKSNDEEVLIKELLYNYFSNANKYKIYIFTNNPIYRPGHEVKYKVIAKKLEDFSYIPLSNKVAEVIIKDEKDESLVKQNKKTNDYGSLDGSFILDENVKLGDYKIQVTIDGYLHFGSFSVEEYKKPEYKVDVQTKSGQYFFKDTLKAEFSADYYFGSPVTNGAVKYEIYRTEYFRPWWWHDPYSWIYRDCFGYYAQSRRVMVYSGEGELNKKGKFTFEYVINESGNENFQYTIVAKVTDQSRREIEASKTVFVTKGEFQITTNPAKYVYKPGEKISIKTKITDFSDKGILSNYSIIVRRIIYDFGDQFFEDIDTLKGKTAKDGIGQSVWIAKEAGNYNYIVQATDSRNNLISARGNFWVSDKKKFSWSIGEFQIITDKDVYEKGDTLNILVLSPSENVRSLLTIEAGTIVRSNILYMDGFSTTYSIVLDKDLPPIMTVFVSYFYENYYYEGNKKFAVIPTDKLLNIQMTADKKNYKPGETGEFSILVKDKNNKPVKNSELTIGISDESIYAVKEEIIPDIKNFFMRENNSYLNTFRTNIRMYYNDVNLFNFNEKDYSRIKKDGDGRLYGVVKLIDENKYDNYNIKAILKIDGKILIEEADEIGEFEFRGLRKGIYELYIKIENSAGYPVTGVGKIIRGIKVDGKSKMKLADISIKIDRMNYREVDYPVLYSNVKAVEETRTQRKDVSSEMQKISSGTNYSFVEPEIRSEFKDAIFWEPSILTDAEGRAKVKVRFSDDLTTWRTTIRTNTLDSRFGQDTFKIISRKDLIIRMETPRFVCQDDVLTISTIIHNYLETDKVVNISAEFLNAILLKSEINDRKHKIENKKTEKDYFVKIPRNGELRIDWKIKVASPAGDLVIRAFAKTDAESDAVERKVRIKTLGVEVAEAKSFTLSELNDTKEFTLEVPKSANLNTIDYKIALTPSISGALLGALDNLVEYPYGCVEQTMSRFLPALVVKNAMVELNINVNSKTLENLPKVISAGFKRLTELQHNDGGWGWWSGDETNAYMTAYVMFGLSMTKKMNYSVDEDIYERGLTKLVELIRETKDDNTLAYLLYSASHIEKSRLNSLGVNFPKYFRLLEGKKNSYINALMVIASRNLGYSDSFSKFEKSLSENVIKEGNQVYWGGEKFYYRWQEDKIQTTALAVKALASESKYNELMEKAIRWLMVQRKGSSWNSTIQTSLIIFAMVDYLKISKELEPDFIYELYINGTKISENRFIANDIFAKETLMSIDKKYLISGNNKILIKKKGLGKLYFASILKTYSAERLKNPIDDIFEISRKFYLSEKVKEGDVYVNKLSKFTGEVKSGQEILVKVKIKSANSHDYFMLEEPIPAGCEFVKETENIEFHPRSIYRPIKRYYYADKEFRDDKISFFVTNLEKGDIEFGYMLRAQIPGRYNILPGMGCLMYYPEVRGTSESMEIEITD